MNNCTMIGTEAVIGIEECARALLARRRSGLRNRLTQREVLGPQAEERSLYLHPERTLTVFLLPRLTLF